VSADPKEGAMYDEAATSAWLREQAALADKEFRESRSDGVLARSCVYGYLYDRYFLETAELLLNELRWLRKSGKPRAPLHAQSVATFDSNRENLLDELIARFEGDQGS
jgi:hypothetical protein